MNEKYIKISDVMKKLNYIFRTYGTSLQMREQIKNAINKIPYVVKRELETTLEGVDIVPVKHGKWLICSDGYYPYCSECKNEPQGRVMTDYCPNCGAKMDGGDKNG